MIAEIGANIMHATFSDLGICACITGVTAMALLTISFRLEPDPGPTDASPAMYPVRPISAVPLAEHQLPQRRTRIASIARVSRSYIEKKRQYRGPEISA
jgi:hypothetical protein